MTATRGVCRHPNETVPGHRCRVSSLLGRRLPAVEFRPIPDAGGPCVAVTIGTESSAGPEHHRVHRPVGGLPGAHSTSTDAAACEAANAEARQMTEPFTFGTKKVDVLGNSYSVGTTLSDPQHEA